MDIMTDELKPVPCGCGGEAKVIMIIEGIYAVECSKCWIRTGDYAPNETEAVKLWNMAMRERTAKVENIHEEYDFEGMRYYKVGYCGNCEAWLEEGDIYCSECGARLEWE